VLGDTLKELRLSSTVKAVIAGVSAFVLLAAACAPSAPSAPPTPAGATPTPVPAAAAGLGIVKDRLAGEAQALNGAGATFPAVLYSKWSAEYEKVTGVKVNYQSIGSGGGIKSIQDATVDFGATDGPMTDQQLKETKSGEVLHIPMVLGAVAPSYNVPEVAGKTINFSAESLAGIFLGTIKKWDDPKLAADNPGLALPNKDIVVVHRSDGSGTTYIWVDYLSSVSAGWKSKVGVGTSVDWPVGLGSKGNEGVSGEIKQNPYSLGYVELIYALQNKLGVGFVKNKAGKYVEPTLASVTAAAASAKAIPADLRASIVNADGPDAYPVSGFTWQLVYVKQADKAKAQALTRWLWWETHDAQRFASGLGYAQLPDEVVKKAEEKILSVTVDGQPAFPHTPGKN
jgi:phosphate transport system substrate-binding protein